MKILFHIWDNLTGIHPLIVYVFKLTVIPGNAMIYAKLDSLISVSFCFITSESGLNSNLLTSMTRIVNGHAYHF